MATRSSFTSSAIIQQRHKEQKILLKLMFFSFNEDRVLSSVSWGCLSVSLCYLEVTNFLQAGGFNHEINGSNQTKPIYSVVFMINLDPPAS